MDTVVRSRAPVVMPDPEPEQHLAPVAPPVPPEPRSRRGAIARLVVGGAAALVIAAVVAGIVLSGGFAGDETPDGSEPTGTPTSAVPQRILAPELASPPTLEGSTVTFVLTNPEPHDDDQFVWRLADRPDQPTLSPVAGDVVHVEGYAGGAPLCIEVMVLRKGKTSEPLAACYPPAS